MVKFIYCARLMSRGLVWLLAISTGCIVANIYYAQPLLADIAREFGLTVPKVGAVFMLTQIGMGRACWSSSRSATSTSGGR